MQVLTILAGVPNPGGQDAVIFPQALNQGECMKLYVSGLLALFLTAGTAFAADQPWS
jgi:hypothetical protein